MKTKYNDNGSSETEDDGWNWSLLLLIALKELNISEEQFWKMRPITYRSLVNALGELNEVDDEQSSQGGKSSQCTATTTIDKIPGW